MPLTMFGVPDDPSGVRFRVGSTPVTVAWSALLVPLVIGSWFTDLGLAAAAAAIVFGSVLIHELGHAAAYRAFGVRSSIVLHALGGVTMGERSVAHRPGRIAVSLAGPFTELVLLGLPAWVALQTIDLDASGRYFMEVVVLVTVGWSLFNLLPLLPLDGGHVTEEVLDVVTRGRGHLPARVVSVVTALAVAVVAVSAGYLLLAVFVLAMAWTSVKELRDRRAVGEIRAMQPALEAYREGRTGEALQQLLPTLHRRRRPAAQAQAVLVAAWAALAEDDVATARQALSHHPTGEQLNRHLRAILLETDVSEQVNATVDAWLTLEHLDSGAYVRWMQRMGLLAPVVERVAASRADAAVQASTSLQEVLFRHGCFELAARTGEGRLAAGLDGHDEHRWLLAFNTACSLDRAGRPEEALRWLEVAAAAGIPDPTMVETDPDLATTRALPGFAEVRRSLATPAPPAPGAAGPRGV